MLLSRFFLSIACLAVALPATVRATVTVKLATPAGDITLDLDDDAKPKTVANFLKYIRDGQYVNTFVHRLPRTEDDSRGFVLQGGGYTYTAQGGFSSISHYDPVENEAGPFPAYSNLEGTIAMAKVAEQKDEDGEVIPGTGADSATSEWFINLGDNSSILDDQNGGFTVFGHVVSGASVVTRFKNFKYYKNADGADLIVSLGSPLSQLPVLSVVNSSIDYLDDLIFTTWTITGGTKPVITSPSTVYSQKGTVFSYQIAATGNPTSFAVSGDPLPSGVTLNTGSGLISGTPTDNTPATLDVTVSATGASGTGSASLSIGYNYPIITEGLSITGTLGKPLQFQIPATNSPTFYDASGLPDGLTLDTDTGLISGKPTVYGSGYVTIYATNDGGTYSASLYIKIADTVPTVTTKKKVIGRKGTVTLKGSASSGTVKVEVQPGRGGFRKAKGKPTNWTFTVRGLKPGTYKFKVRATKQSGKTTITTVTVVVKK